MSAATTTSPPTVTTVEHSTGYRLLHVDGAPVVAVAPYLDGGWTVRLTAAGLGTGRWYRDEPAALVEAARLAEGYTLCRRHVAARLCRLVKRHDGPCLPWS